MDVKYKVEKCLNDAKQYQLCKKTTMFRLPMEGWRYIFLKLVTSGAVLVYLRRNTTSKYMQCDLTMCSRSKKQHLTLLRLQCSASLTAAKCVFGRTFGIGVRNRSPTKGDPGVTLHYGDVVNLCKVPVDAAVDCR